jgi:hypothetical protein
VGEGGGVGDVVRQEGRERWGGYGGRERGGGGWVDVRYHAVVW